MVNKTKVIGLVKELAELHPDDPRNKEYWELLTKELSISEDETIEFLGDCNEYEVYWLSAIFEDVSLVFQSRRFIESLKAIQNKFPELNLEMDIMYAEMALKNN